MAINMILGAGHPDRPLADADELLRGYRVTGDTGLEYMRYVPITPSDRLLPEDLAVTLLVNSRATYRAFQSLRDRGHEVDLCALPACALELASDDDLRRTSEAIASVAGWPGFGASTATKVLHKKRPQLIPLLDNQAIFGAYMNPRWPEKRPSADTVKDRRRIEEALRRIRYDLVRSENQGAWSELHAIELDLTPIELFDAVWWSHFQRNELVKKRPA